MKPSENPANHPNVSDNLGGDHDAEFIKSKGDFKRTFFPDQAERERLASMTPYELGQEAAREAVANMQIGGTVTCPNCDARFPAGTPHECQWEERRKELIRRVEENGERKHMAEVKKVMQEERMAVPTPTPADEVPERPTAEPMGYIQVPINEVWEVTDKPRRFFSYVKEQVEQLPLGDYYMLTFDQETKDEIMNRLEEMRWPSDRLSAAEERAERAMKGYTSLDSLVDGLVSQRNFQTDRAIAAEERLAEAVELMREGAYKCRDSVALNLRVLREWAERVSAFCASPPDEDEKQRDEELAREWVQYQERGAEVSVAWLVPREYAVMRFIRRALSDGAER